MLSLILMNKDLNEYKLIRRKAFEDTGEPRLVSVLYEYEQHLYSYDSEILVKDYDHPRPYVLPMPLVFRDGIISFAVPFRSRIGYDTAPACFFQIGKKNNDESRPGLDFRKMIPVLSDVVNPYTIYDRGILPRQASIVSHQFEYIKEKAQRYLNMYDSNAGFDNCAVDLDLLINKALPSFKPTKAA